MHAHILHTLDTTHLLACLHYIIHTRTAAAVLTTAAAAHTTSQDKDVDIKSNRKNRDEGIGLISNEQGLIQSIQSLLEQLNGGKPVPLGTAAPGNSTSL
jgi:hypothetical protein